MNVYKKVLYIYIYLLIGCIDADEIVGVSTVRSVDPDIVINI